MLDGWVAYFIFIFLTKPSVLDPNVMFSVVMLVFFF